MYEISFSKNCFGNLKGLWLCTIFTFYFGLLSSFAPNFTWILILRSLVGVGVGGVPQAFTLFSEFAPKSHRAKVFSLLSFFGPVGSCIEVIIEKWSLIIEHLKCN